MNLVPITITIQGATAAEIRAHINDLAGAIASGMEAPKMAADTAPEKGTPKVKKDKPAPVEKPIEEAAGDLIEGEDDGPKIEFTDLRALAAAKSKSAGGPAVKALLEKYGSPSLSKVEEKHWAALYADLEKL